MKPATVHLSLLLMILWTAPLLGASVTNNVQNSSVVSLFLEGGKHRFSTGEKFTAQVRVQGNYISARTVLVPSSLGHGDWNLARSKALWTQYLYNDDSVTFWAPSEPGAYEIRVFTGYNPAAEGAVIPITVHADPKRTEVVDNLIPQIGLVVKRSWIVPGESMSVTFSLPSKDLDGPWIGVFPAQPSDAKEISRSSLYKAGSGSISMRAPTAPAQYRLKLFRSADSEPLASFEFRVAK